MFRLKQDRGAGVDVAPPFGASEKTEMVTRADSPIVGFVGGKGRVPSRGHWYKII